MISIDKVIYKLSNQGPVRKKNEFGKRKQTIIFHNSFSYFKTENQVQRLNGMNPFSFFREKNRIRNASSTYADFIVNFHYREKIASLNFLV